MARTSNEKLFDLYLRHQIRLQGLSKKQERQLIKLMNKADAKLNRTVTARLRALGPGKLKLGAFRKEVNLLRKEIIALVGQKIGEVIGDVAEIELAAGKNFIESAVPIEFNAKAPDPATVQATLRRAAFGGDEMALTLTKWMQQLTTADSNRIMGAVAAGLQNGEDIEQIVRRVGNATALTRNNVNALVRTAVNHASNTARNEVFKANSDIITALRWVSTLDGRTSAICRARDGDVGPVPGKEYPAGTTWTLDPPEAQPPAHVRCRSIKVAVLDGEGIDDTLGNRPFVRDTRTRRVREKNFREDAHKKVGDEAWKKMSPADRNGMIRDMRRDWVKTNVGTAPAGTTYEQWLRQQPRSFQNEVLGVEKAKMWRDPDNNLTMDNFVDSLGRERTIAEMQRLYDI
ncbi:MAG: hypothetical protein GY906_28305 [bacterium]|nr:hypothetical protein [bacterium]